jgi:phosphoglycolate phosphatase
VDFNLVIFDCDGVLVDSEPIVNRIFVAMLREFGLVLDEAATLKEFSGGSMPSRIDRIERRLNWTAPKNFIEEFESRLAVACETELRPVPGVREVIESLTVPRCVASNGNLHEMRHRLGLTDLLKYFEPNLFSAADVPRPKPAPDVFLHAARGMNIEPSRCAVIEDSVPGTTAALAAGMKVFAYAGRTDPESLRYTGATVFTSMHNLRLE